MQGCTVAVTGDFGLARSHEKMKQWVDRNGGTFSKDITKSVTHLVCSKEEWKRNAPMGISVHTLSCKGRVTDTCGQYNKPKRLKTSTLSASTGSKTH